ncbi:hypothetical protein ABBQ38_004250 [Trebouxia sp. C0009 RCD-2024]
MSDVSVRGSVLYVSKLWDTLSASRLRSRPARPSRTYRVPAASSAAPVADRAGTYRNTGAAGSHSAESASEGSPCRDLGYQRGLRSRFDIGEKIGSGGNAVVCVVQDKLTRKVFACKSITKTLEGRGVSECKSAGHIASIKREIQVLKKLRGSLNVACLEEVYEDDASVHLVLDYCQGGELVHAIGSRHYSERTVASYMRAVLRTLTQCHSNHILHRDVKPGNFMLLRDHDRSPLKAIDFGLAVPFESATEPRSDLGLEGTPWYMAPEVLSSEVLPASDVWSAGVMAYQLLTGQFPFDDKQNPFKPSVAKIWASILTGKLDFNKKCWDGVSSGAKDFVRSLLIRDPAERPTAKQALHHPWVRGRVAERSIGQPLGRSVIQRIQRFASGSLFKRTVFQYIAEDLAADPGVSNAKFCLIDSEARPLVTMPSDSPLRNLLSSLDLEDNDVVDRHSISEGLQRLGYKLDVDEVEQLLDHVDTAHTGVVAKSQLAASQIDWEAMQQSNAERWLASAQKVFQDFDTDGDGIISSEQILDCLRSKIPPSEVQAALEQAMQEANKREQSMHKGLSFENFLRMLRSNSSDSLDQYDDRMSGGGSSHGASAYEQLDNMDKSVRCGDVFVKATTLDSIPEVC